MLNNFNRSEKKADMDNEIPSASSKPPSRWRQALSFRNRLVISFILLATITSATILIVSYTNYRSNSRAVFRQRLHDAVSMAALQQNGDTFQNIKSATDPEYNRLRLQNMAIRKSSPDYRFVYTMRYDDQGLYFVVDAGTPGEAGFSTINERYQQPGPVLAANYRKITGVMVEDQFYTDEYGSFLSAYAPIRASDGKVVGIIAIDITANNVLAAERAFLLDDLIFFLILLPLIALAGWFLGNSLSSPIQSLARAAARLGAGDLDYSSVVKSNIPDFLLLDQAFMSMALQLKNLISSLEQRVRERTRGLELAAEIGRSVSQVRGLDVMLRDAAEIIRTRFDLYYVQVYLVDPVQNVLLLKSGTGTVGVELVSRRHRLPLDTGSINGRAAIEKHPVVISDTSASVTFRQNPLLPETRSEISVPLMVGEKVVGVLDMQSQKAGALSQDGLPAYEALAGQLAIAIQNDSLLGETDQARQEIEKQARRQTRTNWNDYMDAIHTSEQIGFSFNGDTVSPLTEEISQSPADGQALSAPIALTGEQLGSLVVELTGENQTPQNAELVQTVARQVAQQIENLRLLDSAERYRHEAEEATRRLTRGGWKEFVESQTGQSTLNYMYDSREVRPFDRDTPVPSSNSFLTRPVKVRDEAIGTLAVQGIGPQETESADLINAVAARLGAHIESLRLYDQTQSALSQSNRLFEAGSRLTQAGDMQDLVRVAAESLDIPEINRAVLGIFNYGEKDEFESMTVAANWWNGVGNPATDIGTHYPVGLFQTFSLFASPTPRFTEDAYTDPRVDESTLQLAKTQNFRSVAVLPLYQGPRQVGVLMLEGDKTHKFNQDEMRLLSALAPQIATVLENRRQFERARRQAERETMLNTIGQKIQSATSVEAVLQIAARELGRALGAPLTIAQLGIKDKN